MLFLTKSMLLRKLIPATPYKHWLTVPGTQETSNIQNFAMFGLTPAAPTSTAELYNR